MTKATLDAAEVQIRGLQLEVTQLKEQAQTETQRMEASCSTMSQPTNAKIADLEATHQRDIECLENAQTRIAQLEADNTALLDKVDRQNTLLNVTKNFVSDKIHTLPLLV